jgi:EpsD family peptidyl-prolyl cis-trans isomerase
MFRSVCVSSRVRAGAACLALAVLAACGGKTAADSSEVAAKVNGEPVTVAEINAALPRQRGPQADPADAAGRAMLDRLIETDILAQKAVKAKLDQDPRVLAQIESARRDILARRFVEEVAETGAKPTPAQVRQFFDERPNLFGQRKVFTLQRLDIQVPDDRRTEVDAHVSSLKTSAELTDWLKAQNLKFTSRQEQAASEQIPPQLLEKLVALKDGESTVVPSATGVMAVTRVSAAAAPKTLADARPAIEQFLAMQGKREAIMNLQKTVKDGAQIEYVGRFAPGAASAAGAAPPAPASVSANSAATPAASPNLPASK